MASAITRGQILVETSSVGLNPADCKLCELGLLSRIFTPYPKIPGMDLSGRVVGVADDVADTALGDFVIARVDPWQNGGTLAQFAVIGHVEYATIPADFDLDQAAGAPTAALTAFQTIQPYVKKGDRVFINGGSGGVGLFGFQIVKALGCYVTVNCSTVKANLCKSLGADELIDYKTNNVLTELSKHGQVYSLCVDNIGSSPPNLYASSYTFLQSSGKFVFVGGQLSAYSLASISSTLLVPSFLSDKKRKFIIYATSSIRADMESVRDLLMEGKIKAVIDTIFSFDEVSQAFKHIKKGSGAGGNIIRVKEADVSYNR